MSSALFDLVLLWSPHESETDYPELQNLLKTEFSNQFNIHLFTQTQDAIKHVESKSNSSLPVIVITKLGMTDESLGEPLIEIIRHRNKSTFIILHSHKVCADPNLRWYFAELGVNMITEYVTQIRDVFQRLLPLGQSHPKPTYTCPYCKWTSLSFSQLYTHVPLYHTNEGAMSIKCELCQQSTRNYAVHLHEEHDQEHRQGPKATPLYAFALVVCQRKRDNRFLVVQESGSMGFWLPGGRVEVGEQLDKAAERETLEEAGVRIRITGVLKIEFTPRSDINRLRIIYFAEPLDEDNCEPKTVPDYESYGAMWLTYEQTVQCSTKGQLRGNEPLKWFKYVTQNGAIHPLSILSKTEL
ncbi:unnamed protein product [Adineta steineri]|uniref:Nudix hydrolase domain-containing protein n=1 Tax=Adineta steineri TaxID=433720 RepID=A0A814ISY4_9BILA|nr:unnamed protein product [Adineta steineri]CAF1063801.1 unnamed protein product [Adineta steineri]